MKKSATKNKKKLTKGQIFWLVVFIIITIGLGYLWYKNRTPKVETSLPNNVNTTTTTNNNVVSLNSGVYPLTYGMRGNTDVIRLQNKLIEKGFLATGNNTGNYLDKTKAAVAQAGLPASIDKTTLDKFILGVAILPPPPQPTSFIGKIVIANRNDVEVFNISDNSLYKKAKLNEYLGTVTAENANGSVVLNNLRYVHKSLIKV